MILGVHDTTRYKFSECIKNDRKALELWGFGFWNFTCMKDHWRFPNYKFKTFTKIGISHLKEIWPIAMPDEVETSRFLTKFNDFVKIMKINDLKNDHLFEKIFKEFSEKSFDFLSNFFSETSKSPTKTMFSILKKLTKFSEKSRNFSFNFSWNRQNHLLKLIFQCWKNWRCFLMKIEFFVQILFQKLKITNQNQLLNLKQIQEKIKILSNENSKPEGIWKVIIQKVSSTKRKLDGKYWKMNRFSMKKFQINFRKHWFTDVKSISKTRDKKRFPFKIRRFCDGNEETLNS